MEIRSRQMKKILVLAGFFHMMIANAAGEFDDSYLLPYVETVAFLKDSIVINTRRGSEIPNLFDQQSYLLDRNNHSARQLSPVDLATLMNKNNVESVVPVTKLPSNIQETSDGVPYQVPNVGCETRKRNSTTTISFDSKDLVIAVNSCSNISTIEGTDEHLWVGTYSAGQYESSGAEGLLVIDRKTGKIVFAIDTGYHAIYGSARDPISGDMWFFVADRIIVATSNKRHRTIMQFYHDFDASTGGPVMKLEAGWHSSNPLAVLATLLPQEHQTDFYREMRQHLPERLTSEFRLYDFFMTRATHTRLPNEFSFMGPFLVAASKQAMETNTDTGRPRQLQAAGWWQHLACRIDHPDAQDLCPTQ